MQNTKENYRLLSTLDTFYKNRDDFFTLLSSQQLTDFLLNSSQYDFFYLNYLLDISQKYFFNISGVDIQISYEEMQKYNDLVGQHFENILFSQSEDVRRILKEIGNK